MILALASVTYDYCNGEPIGSFIFATIGLLISFVSLAGSLYSGSKTLLGRVSTAVSLIGFSVSCTQTIYVASKI